MPSIEFVNHASVLLSDGKVSLLTDPWYFGETFHRGWSLLAETGDADIRAVLARTDYIWISHEHPDHFSPPFFLRYRDAILARGIRVLFQATRDRRVSGFLRNQGFEVQELRDADELELSPGFTVRTVRSDLYDSALLAKVGGVKVFNLNDCPLNSEADLRAFAGRYGSCDVLLTQFSYAAWKGGRGNRAWRERAARAKLGIMRRQIAALRPSACVPFASFVRFSNELNAYMNDAVNQPARVAAEMGGLPARLVFMRPGETQPLGALAQDSASLAFWQARFEAVPGLPLGRYETTQTVESLRAACQAWRKRVFGKNSRLLMRLARRLLAMRPFDAATVRLIDLDKTLRVSLFDGLREAGPGEAADVALHSASLAFAFDNDFGLDTLMVNGCFEEARPGGFDRYAKCFAAGSMNALGIYIGPSIVRRLDVVGMMLRKLLAIRRSIAETG